MGKKEKPLTHMLPYVNLVDDVTVRTRGNELFQCIRLEGVNSSTTDDDYLDRTRALFASIISQIGPEFAFYVHKVSKAIEPGPRAPSPATTSRPPSIGDGPMACFVPTCATRR